MDAEPDWRKAEGLYLEARRELEAGFWVLQDGRQGGDDEEMGGKGQRATSTICQTFTQPSRNRARVGGL